MVAAVAGNIMDPFNNLFPPVCAGDKTHWPEMEEAKKNGLECVKTV